MGYTYLRARVLYGKNEGRYGCLYEAHKDRALRVAGRRDTENYSDPELSYMHAFYFETSNNLWIDVVESFSSLLKRGTAPAHPGYERGIAPRRRIQFYGSGWAAGADAVGKSTIFK